MLAQVTPPAPPQPPPLLGAVVQYLPIVLVILLMYFFVFNAKRKDEKKRRTMIDELKRGDRIQTIGGVLGTVVTAEGNEIVVKVDESNNTKIRFVRTAVHKIVGDTTTPDVK